MSKKIDINVHHITRVEGHGNIVLRTSDGTIEKLEWQVPEAPRFFEAMVRGRMYDEVQPIVSRICGICSVFNENSLCIFNHTFYLGPDGKANDCDPAVCISFAGLLAS